MKNSFGEHTKLLYIINRVEYVQMHNFMKIISKLAEIA